jgi:RND family efflux transporter MFP subunit
VLVGSLGLSALLAGGVVSGLAVWSVSQKRMEDAEFLRGQLERVTDEQGGPDGQKAGPGESAPSSLVRVSVAQRKVIQPQRPIVGRLVEVRKVTVASEVTGKIVKMPVEEGTPVVDGETVLAQVDDVWCGLAADRCRARLKCEELDLERHEQLTDKRAISASELQSKQATVDELRASLEEENERIARSTILAPFDGTVVVKHAEEGGYVSPGDPIVDIVSRGRVDAKLMIPESAINLIRVGQVLPIWVDPLGEEVEGEVVSLTPYGPTASRTFPVRVRLDDQGGRLKVGMSVTASIAIGSEREALVVSKDAVLVRPDGSTVWVALPQAEPETGEVQPVPVTITARMPEEYAVEPETGEGRALLVAGAQVVVEGAERLLKGQRVGIDRRIGGPSEAAKRGEGAGPTRRTTSTKAASGPASRQES